MVTEVTETERWWCVVTGGRGFAARHLVEMLVRYQMFHVRIADLAPAVQLDAHEETGLLGDAMRSGRVQYVSADLRNKAQVIKGIFSHCIVFVSDDMKWKQRLKEHSWCFTWQLQIHPSTVASFTVLLMFKVV